MKKNRDETKSVYRSNVYLMLILVFFLCIVLVMINIGEVSASFVCGQLADSVDNMSSDWFDVMIYAPENPFFYSLCKVSPDQNKYCCDAEEVFEDGVDIGDVVYSEVINDNGYVSGPVSLTISGEGYDLFPLMTLEKVIDIKMPLGRVIFLNESAKINEINDSLEIFEIPFIFEGGGSYNKFYLDNGLNRTLLCDDCDGYNGSLKVKSGMNDYIVQASSEFREINVSHSFGVITGYNSSISSVCDKCKENKVPSGEDLVVVHEIHLSDRVENMKLVEYVPIDFEIVDSGNGVVRTYSSTHNMIEWVVSGKNIYVNYSVHSPSIFWLSKYYVFSAELEGLNIAQDQVKVSGIIPFFSSSNPFERFLLKKQVYSWIQKGQPLVLKPRNNQIKRIAFFVNDSIYNVECSLFEEIPETDYDTLLFYYSYDSNSIRKYLDNIYIEFVLDNEVYLDPDIKEFNFFYYDGEYYNVGLLPKPYKNDSFDYYFNVTLPYSEGFGVYIQKEKLFGIF